MGYKLSFDSIVHILNRKRHLGKLLGKCAWERRLGRLRRYLGKVSGYAWYLGKVFGYLGKVPG